MRARLVHAHLWLTNITPVRPGFEEGTGVLPCSYPGKYFSGGAAAMVQVGLATAQTGGRHCEPHVSASSS